MKPEMTISGTSGLAPCSSFLKPHDRVQNVDRGGGIKDSAKMSSIDGQERRH